MPDKRITTIVEEPPIPTDNAPNIVAYRVGQLEDAVRIGFKEHNEKLDQLVTNFATNDTVAGIDIRVTSLESDRKWLVRLVVGAVVFAVLALIGVGFKLNK